MTFLDNKQPETARTDLLFLLSKLAPQREILMKKTFLLITSHGLVGIFGFALGIYMLPILTAPDSPSGQLMTQAASQSEYSAQFKRDLDGSDFFHWGEGKVSIGKQFIALDGKVAPGPDYKLYLSPVYVENEKQFLQNKQSMVQVGDVKTFENFVLPVPSTIDPSAYNAVIIWCESFGEFITAAQYKS
jgi:hypothetical protein